jgi:uncharacterized membrane protein
MRFNQDSLTYFAIFAMLVLPVICLDYIFAAASFEKITVPNGQYIFFFTTILSAIYIRMTFGDSEARPVFFDKRIAVFLSFLVLGVFLSFSSIWNIRLFVIVGLTSLSAVLFSSCVNRLKPKFYFILIICLLFPFAFPVVIATALELTGPIDLGLVFENIKHNEYSPPRWHFLYSSSNGFGFNAALVLVAVYIAFIISDKNLERFLFITLGAVALFALISSGTRAAFIFALTSLSFFTLSYFGMRALYWLAFAIIFIFIAISFLIGFEQLSAFLRLDGSNLNNISSGRINGIRGMWALFIESPFQGMGFGAADKSFPVYPTNIFYFALPAEIGVFGSIGVLGIIGLPLYYLFKRAISEKKVSILQSKSYICMFSSSVLVGFIPYLLFEFNIFRVSGVNQLFFFCWGITMVAFKEKNDFVIVKNDPR